MRGRLAVPSRMENKGPFRERLGGYAKRTATLERKGPKRATKSMSRKRRGSGKRELVKNQASDFFARRTGGGQFKELDRRGRSLAQDRRRKAKTTGTPGRGDRGDRKTDSR
jgi:hypothetical protein